MDILMSETCWAHKKWNKIASDIKLVFYSSTKTLNSVKMKYIVRDFYSRDSDVAKRKGLNAVQNNLHVVKRE